LPAWLVEEEKAGRWQPPVTAAGRAEDGGDCEKET